MNRPRRLITLYDDKGEEVKPVPKKNLVEMQTVRWTRAKRLLAQWRTKEKRAKTAIRKLKKTCDYYEWRRRLMKSIRRKRTKNIEKICQQCHMRLHGNGAEITCYGGCGRTVWYSKAELRRVAKNGYVCQPCRRRKYLKALLG